MGQLCQRRKKQPEEDEQESKSLVNEKKEKGVAKVEENQNESSKNQLEKKTVRVALVGAKGVGKSTIFDQVSFQKKNTKKLSQKVSQEIGNHEELEIVCWTISEEDQDITMSDKILKNFDAIAYVIDRTKRENLRSDGLLMRQFISCPAMLELPLLILINKSDQQGVGFWEVNQEIGLEYIQQREIHIQNCSGKQNEGIDVGINKLLLFVELLRQKKEKAINQ